MYILFYLCSIEEEGLCQKMVSQDLAVDGQLTSQLFPGQTKDAESLQLPAL